MKRLLQAVLGGCALVLVLAGLGHAEVKLSKSGICHPPQSPSYGRTTSFKPFPTLDGCLQAGGRLPKNCPDCGSSEPVTAKVPAGAAGLAYNRAAFGDWADSDGDCQNTRAEMLASLSTGTVLYSGNRECRVVRGRWLDPYSGRIFVNAADVDVDHLVPLKWAWSRGAHDWSSAKRKKFANDPVNLFVVDATENRSKGAKGPAQWLPSNKGYHCEYITRFIRVAKTYGLDLSRDITRFNSIRADVCS
ncbi:HNH endonuclease family protein [Roseibium sp. RKSG952]|uniref:HNH endonuclease family protein n=1 Tax=Roseibium sp. RKSG952 TaxID=2529384 RepID=UPI001AD8A28E|nr:HNH endonuclease family protein [Roseibium sp. RKSG952]